MFALSHWKDIGINLVSSHRQIWYENFYLFTLLLNIQYVCELNNKRVVLLMKYESLCFHCFRHTTTIQIRWMANTLQWSVGRSWCTDNSSIFSIPKTVYDVDKISSVSHTEIPPSAVRLIALGARMLYINNYCSKVEFQFYSTFTSSTFVHAFHVFWFPLCRIRISRYRLDVWRVFNLIASLECRTQDIH